MHGPRSSISPPHYQSHPSGIQCIEITRHFPFAPGNVIKYLWRFYFPGGRRKRNLSDLYKALWYLQDAINSQPNSSEHLVQPKASNPPASD